MRVVFLGTGVQPVPPVGYGGVERTISELTEALRAAGAEVEVVQRIRHGRSIDEYWFARELPGLLAGRSFDILHASTPVVANRLAGRHLPFFYTTHSRHWFERRGIRQRWGAYLERRAVPRSAHTVALTEPLRVAIARACPSLPESRLSVIPIGVDAQKFRPDEGARSGSVALGVGVVAPIKRWEIAARALKGTGWTLKIAGPIRNEEYARSVRAAGDRVELLGEVGEEELEKLFGQSDLYVHPSRVELLAGAVLQAMAAALPVLGTPVIAGVVRDGETGFISPTDADAEVTPWLRTTAERLRGDAAERRRLGEAGRAAALGTYSWARVAASHLTLYQSLLDSGALTRR